nr:hypothetical protein [Acidobacteriota bacterium]
MSAKRNTRVVQEHRRGAPKAPSHVEAPSTCSSSSIPRGAAVAGEAMANRAAALARSRAYRALHRRRAARTQAISTILDGELSLKKTVDAIKKVLVLDALKNNRWFRRRAAAELKVTYRIFNNMVSHLGLDALHKSMRAAMRKGAGSSSGKRTDPFDLFSIHLPYGESGVMDYDPLTDSLRCHFCGERFKNLAQHARKVHGLSSSDYRELAGLNRRTRLISQGVRERLREVTAPRCERLRAEGRKRSWGEDPELLARAKAAAVEASKSGMRPEGRRHRRE